MLIGGFVPYDFLLLADIGLVCARPTPKNSSPRLSSKSRHWTSNSRMETNLFRESVAAMILHTLFVSTAGANSGPYTAPTSACRDELPHPKFHRATSARRRAQGIRPPSPRCRRIQKILLISLRKSLTARLTQLTTSVTTFFTTSTKPWEPRQAAEMAAGVATTPRNAGRSARLLRAHF